MAWVRLSDAVRRVRGDAVQRGAGPVRDALLADGSNVLVTADLRAGGRERCASPRRTWPSLDQAAAACGRRDAGLAARKPRRCRISATCWRARAAGKGRVVLVPRLDGVRQVEIALPGGFNVTPRLAQALTGCRGGAGRGDLVLAESEIHALRRAASRDLALAVRTARRFRAHREPDLPC